MNNQTEFMAPPEMAGIQRTALIIGGLGVILLIVGLVVDSTQFFRSYIMAWMFWLGIALGSLALLMMQHLTGGDWGMMIRRVLESASRCLWLMALLFIPIIFGLKVLYPWARPEDVAQNEALQHKAVYMNVPFFIIRAVIYFAVWIAISYFLNRWSTEQDRTGDPGLLRKFGRLSGPGLVIYGFTITFASIDWIMSLNAEWFSTIYGMLYIGGQGLSAMAFAIAMDVYLARREPMAGVILPRHLHDLGKLMLAFVMIWAYLSFSQFLIIWAGNLPEENIWYVNRMVAGWKWIGLMLIVLHFALPFLLLLSRELKRDARKIGAVAVFVIFMRLVDLFWLTAPEFHGGTFHLSWLDLVAPAGIGGLWMAFFAYQLRKRPLLPVNDPNLESALVHSAH